MNNTYLVVYYGNEFERYHANSPEEAILLHYAKHNQDGSLTVDEFSLLVQSKTRAGYTTLDIIRFYNRVCSSYMIDGVYEEVSSQDTV